MRRAADRLPAPMFLRRSPRKARSRPPVALPPPRDPSAPRDVCAVYGTCAHDAGSRFFVARLMRWRPKRAKCLGFEARSGTPEFTMPLARLIRRASVFGRARLVNFIEISRLGPSLL